MAYIIFELCKPPLTYLRTGVVGVSNLINETSHCTIYWLLLLLLASAHSCTTDSCLFQSEVLQIKLFLLVYGAVKTTINDQGVVWVFGKSH